MIGDGKLFLKDTYSIDYKEKLVTREMVAKQFLPYPEKSQGRSCNKMTRAPDRKIIEPIEHVQKKIGPLAKQTSSC